METNINLTQFISNYKALVQRYEEIAKLPYSNENGELQSVSFDIESNEFVFHTEEYSRGEYTTEKMYIHIDNINKPLNWFAKQFLDKHNKIQETAKIKAQEQEKRKLDADRLTYEELKKKFE